MWQPKIRLFTRERVSYEGTSRTRQATRCWGEIERKLTNTLVRTTYIRDIKIEWEHASESLRVLSVNSEISGFREIVILTSSCGFFLMNNQVIHMYGKIANTYPEMTVEYADLRSGV
jgi:hypothetical protein